MLKYAITKGANGAVDYILSMKGFDYNARDSYGVNCLWYACSCKNIYALKRIMKIKDDHQKCLIDIQPQHPKVGNALHCCIQNVFATGATVILSNLMQGNFYNY